MKLMSRARVVPLAVVAVAVLILSLGGILLGRAESKTNKVALSVAPKPVTVVAATKTTYRDARHYVGTLEPWLEAKVGPQFVSAYVDSVLVRPGAKVKQGDVIATLDCRNASAESRAVNMQARALEARQRAIANEVGRVNNLLDGGFVSVNEAEQKSAQSETEQAQLLAAKAKLLSSTLEVGDCVLRAPFDGDVAARAVDPGAFVRPGANVATVVDRTTMRITGEAPEVDFDIVAPGTPVTLHLLATKRDLKTTITRRAPAADDATRTVHFEIDVANPTGDIPARTTAEIRIEVGEPRPACELPLIAASIRGAKAKLFVVENGVAHARTLPFLGEREGSLFVPLDLAPGSRVVTEGRALLDDGDHVNAQEQRP